MRTASVNKNHYEVSKFLMDYPFNTSQSGFGFLVKSITKVLDLNRERLKLGKDIYEPLAKECNVGLKQFERAIREALQTVSVNCCNDKGRVYPSGMIKSAFEAPTAKSFIFAVVSQITLNRQSAKFKSSKR